MDTTVIDGDSCIDLAFTPFNVESFGFTGHIYVTNDTALFIKSVAMNVPHEINMNFVENLKITLEFGRATDGTRLLKRETLTTEMKVVNGVTGFMQTARLYTATTLSWATSLPSAYSTTPQR
jgi:hypothetical protein